MDPEPITAEIVNAALKIHRGLGPGPLELPVGLLINFGAPTLKEGLHRVVSNHNPSAASRLRVNQP